MSYILSVFQEREKKKDFPVFVWIHGGSYFWGAGSLFGPSYFLDNDVILVTLNYRLGPLGEPFLIKYLRF